MQPIASPESIPIMTAIRIPNTPRSMEFWLLATRNPTTVPANPIVPSIDRSMLPVSTTKVNPKASTSGVAICVRIVIILVRLKKPGAMTANTAIKPSSTMAGEYFVILSLLF